MTPQPTQAALSLAATIIAAEEAFVPAPYYDALGRVWSQGYGFCTLADGSRVGPRSPRMTQGQAHALLLSKLRTDYTASVLRACAGTALTDNQVAALSSWAWNLGAGRLATTGIPGKLTHGDVQGAALELLAYDHAGGRVVPGLTARRHREAHVLLGGAYDRNAVPAVPGGAGANRATEPARAVPGAETPTTADLNDAEWARVAG